MCRQSHETPTSSLAHTPPQPEETEEWFDQEESTNAYEHQEQLPEAEGEQGGESYEREQSQQQEDENRPCLEINRERIQYGKVLQGSCTVETFTIRNPHHSPHLVLMNIEGVDNWTFFQLHESFSESNRTRKQSSSILLAPQEIFEVNLNLEAIESGHYQFIVRLRVGKTCQELTIPVSVEVKGVEIVCPRMMEGPAYSCIKVAVKVKSKLEFKLPFRNNGDLPLSLAIEIIKFEDNPLDSMLSIFAMTGTINLKPKSPFILQFGLKRLATLKLSWARPKMRRMVVLRVQGSRFCMGVPVEVELLEGKGVSE